MYVLVHVQLWSGHSVGDRWSVHPMRTVYEWPRMAGHGRAMYALSRYILSDGRGRPL